MKALRPLICLLAFFAAGTSHATTLILNPSQFTTLYSEGELSNSAGDHLFAGQTMSGAHRRGLLSFDLSSLSGATISSVTLQLNMNRTSVGPVTVSLHLVTSDWGVGGSNAGGQEGNGATALVGDATWNNRIADGVGGGTAWGSAGGDFISGASAQVSVNALGNYQWSGATLTSNVQDWVDSTLSNFGWILVGDETTASSKRFAASAGIVPTLTIEYTAVPEPASAAGLLALAGLTLGVMRRRR